jgi:hypothetical protein
MPSSRELDMTSATGLRSTWTVGPNACGFARAGFITKGRMARAAEKHQGDVLTLVHVTSASQPLFQRMDYHRPRSIQGMPRGLKKSLSQGKSWSLS